MVSKIACFVRGILDLKLPAAHIYPLKDAVDALHLTADPKNGSIRVQLVGEVEEHVLS